MDLMQALVLGVVQGATEFLPISSSGHLVLVPWVLRWQPPELTFDIFVHWGTLAAVVIYFHRDLWALLRAGLLGIRKGEFSSDPQRRLAWLILLGTIPAGVAGVLFKDFFTSLFREPQLVALCLMGTGLLLWGAEYLGRRTDSLAQMRWTGALLIGLGQAMAIAPGISRSGATIAAGLVIGLQREAATRFSFLLSVPIILGAGVLQLREWGSQGGGGMLLLGFLTAFVSGYLSIHFLLRYVQRHSLHPFAVYCWVVGLLGLLISIWW
ncbi:MAG: undecaprenyl-diphosphatase UppP [Nitrospinota bacterium]|nr:MAG: undecaprenyl-diphosphatase UppP [Nitrospinota bacterium]